MAMMSVTYADALIACFDAKYHYAFWRPITAIRAGDTDGNAATVGDPAWSPLLPATPNHPEYPSAHSCVTPAGGRVIAEFLGTQRDRLHHPEPDRPRRPSLRPRQRSGVRGQQRPHLGRHPLPLRRRGRDRDRQEGRERGARPPLPEGDGTSAAHATRRSCTEKACHPRAFSLRRISRGGGKRTCMWLSWYGYGITTPPGPWRPVEKPTKIICAPAATKRSRRSCARRWSIWSTRRRRPQRRGRAAGSRRRRRARSGARRARPYRPAALAADVADDDARRVRVCGAVRLGHRDDRADRALVAVEPPRLVRDGVRDRVPRDPVRPSAGAGAVDQAAAERQADRGRVVPLDLRRALPGARCLGAVLRFSRTRGEPPTTPRRVSFRPRAIRPVDGAAPPCARAGTSGWVGPPRGLCSDRRRRGARPARTSRPATARSPSPSRAARPGAASTPRDAGARRRARARAPRHVIEPAANPATAGAPAPSPNHVTSVSSHNSPRLQVMGELPSPAGGGGQAAHPGASRTRVCLERVQVSVPVLLREPADRERVPRQLHELVPGQAAPPPARRSGSRSCSPGSRPGRRS